MNRIIKLIILFVIGYLVYKYFKKATPVGTAPNFGDGGFHGRDSITTDPNKAKKKVDNFCNDLLTNPRAGGKYSRKDLPIMGAYGYDAINKGQFELMPMASATDLPYTFTVQNIATGKYYTHYHGTNPNGGWGTGGYIGKQGSPTTRFKDLPAGDYKWSVITKSGCKQSTIRTLG
tara:strand:+ start:944 stop:1468 length:525 start_codon:yes stop_codon:yes gene_type:complete